MLLLSCICYAFGRVCLLMPCGRLLASWFSFVMSNCGFVTFSLISWSGVVIDCIDSRSLPYFLLLFMFCVFHALASVHCCLVVTCWEMVDHLAVVCDV